MKYCIEKNSTCNGTTRRNCTISRNLNLFCSSQRPNSALPLLLLLLLAAAMAAVEATSLTVVSSEPRSVVCYYASWAHYRQGKWMPHSTRNVKK